MYILTCTLLMYLLGHVDRVGRKFVPGFTDQQLNPRLHQYVVPFQQDT